LRQLGGVTAEDVPTQAAPSQEQWMSDIDDAFGAQTVIQRTDDYSRYLREHEAAEAAAREPAESESTGLTGLLSILSGDEGASEDVASDDASFQRPSQPQNAEATADGETQSPIESDDDPFAWMGALDIEVIEPSTEVKDFLGDAMGVEQMGSLEPAQEDALAWAKASGIDMTDDATDGAVNYDDDPFAWMRGSGVEIVSDELPPLPSAEPQLLGELSASEVTDDAVTGVPQDDEEPETEASQPVFSGSGVSGLLSFMGNDLPADDSGGAMGDNNDIPDWLKASSTDGEPEETPTDAQPEGSTDGGMDWLADLQPATESEESALAWQEDAPATEEDDSDADASVPEWMAALKDIRDPMELSNLSTVESAIIQDSLTLDEVDSGLFDTLTVDGTFATDVTDEDAATEEPPAWLFTDPPTTVAVRPDEPEEPMPAVTFNPQDDLLLVSPPIMNSTTEEMMVMVEETPIGEIAEDWMASMAVNAPSVENAPSDLEAESNGDDTEDWMASMAANAPSAENDPLASEVESNGDDAEDWMASMAANAPSATPAENAPSVSTGDDSPFDVEPAASSDDVDFASLGFTPQSDTVEDDPSSNFDWLTDSSPVTPAVNPAFDMSEDDDGGMDWLAASAPTDATPSAFDAPADADDDGSMDWLAASAPTDATPSAFDAPADADDDGGMDWLAASAPTAATPSAFDAPADADDDGGMDWLAAIAPNQGVTKLLPKEDDFSLSFFDDAQPESTELGSTFFDEDSVTLNTPDASMFDFDVDEPTVQSGMTNELFRDIADDNDLLMADSSPIELTDVNAFSAPDWLNALAPGLEVDTDSVDTSADSEYLGGGRGEYGWLNALVDEEMRPPVMISRTRTPRFPFVTPPQWLQTVREETQQISAMVDDMDADDDGLPDWLNDMDDTEQN